MCYLIFRAEGKRFQPPLNTALSVFVINILTSTFFFLGGLGRGWRVNVLEELLKLRHAY